MERWRPYFSFRGRTSRRDYWATLFLLVVISAIIWGAGLGLAMATPAGAILLVLLIGPAAASFCLSTRRLHDRNKSAWWLLPFSFLPSFLFRIGEVAATQSDTGGAGAFFALVGFCFWLWGFVEMGCRRGTEGPNKYGDDPLNPIPAEVFA